MHGLEFRVNVSDMESAQQTQDPLEHVREFYVEQQDEWDFFAVNEGVDPEFQVTKAEFDEFTEQVEDGDRRRCCGRLGLEIYYEEGIDGPLCYDCGAVLQ